MLGFRNKVVLVTGATSGIGRAAAVHFGRQEAHVVVAGRREKEGHETVRLVREAGGDALFVPCDVSRRADVDRLFLVTEEHFDRIDAAFNNAGADETLTPFQDETDAEFDRIMGVNVRALWWCMQHEIRAMTKAGRGAIVNTASIGGLVGMANVAVYCASKHAVVGLTRTAALEVAKRGVRVNAVAPAAIATDMYDRFANTPEIRSYLNAMHPVGRIGTSDEVAAAVVWLASDAASFVTGAVLPIDGGLTAT
jgi:NAD(P)-dependent dehydrogenase (short-subunit alcohol dehydrogenase family)